MVGRRTLERLERLFNASSNDFGSLAKICELDPATDFQFRDFRGVDLSMQHVESFNFSGSDLSDADLRGGQFSEGGLDGCRLTGALFSETKIGGRYVYPEDLPDLAKFKDINAHWCPEMVVIPSGTVTLFNPGGFDWEYDQDELEPYTSEVKRFALSKWAISRGQFLKFFQETNQEIAKYIELQPSSSPVTNVIKSVAIKYCQWLSDKTGYIYRLPTEIEWEWAWRSGKDTGYDYPFYWGKWEETSYYKGYSIPSIEPNPFGLQRPNDVDEEWCAEDVPFGGDEEYELQYPGEDSYEPWPKQARYGAGRFDRSYSYEFMRKSASDYPMLSLDRVSLRIARTLPE